jgi:hypothetical protein
LAAGFLAAGFLAFLVAIVFISLVLLNFGIFSFSEGAGIMLAAAEFVNGVKQNIFGAGSKLIACYCAHLRYPVRYVI